MHPTWPTNPSKILLGPFQGRPGTLPGPSRTPPGNEFGSYWGPIWINLGPGWASQSALPVHCSGWAYLFCKPFFAHAAHAAVGLFHFIPFAPCVRSEWPQFLLPATDTAPSKLHVAQPHARGIRRAPVTHSTRRFPFTLFRKTRGTMRSDMCSLL